MRGIGSSLIALLLLATLPSALEAAPVAVRFPEGSLRGFLILRGPKGEELAVGELQQQVREKAIQSRLVFRFKDGSLHDERAVFTQRKIFALRQYDLTQRGPSFPGALEASLDGETGRYKVKTMREGKNEETLDGKLELPRDVSNGLVSILLKNLPKGAARTVHVVAFTPKPQILEVELAPLGEDRFSIAEEEQRASHYRLRPKLGLAGAVASLVGKDIPDYHYWIVSEGTPAFLAFEGPLYVDGPTWRVELASPRWRNRQRSS